MPKIELSKAAYALICGLIQPDYIIDHSRVYAEDSVWDEIRNKFPVSKFPAHIGPYDDPDATVWYGHADEMEK